MKVYYSNDDRYSGLPIESSDRKLPGFIEQFEQTGVSSDEMPRVYCTMLKGLALKHYCDALHERNINRSAPVQTTRQRFITAEHTRTLIRKWDDTTLRIVIIAEHNKTQLNVFQFMLVDSRTFSLGFHKSTEANKICMKCFLESWRTSIHVSWPTSNPLPRFQGSSAVCTHPSQHHQLRVSTQYQSVQC